ncbi:carboxynorspermidine decarboxylase [Methylococcus sp. EFPC2]|uniref:carboxynorspermidine decarboxylase n=1 Tax=Methylococcus sp. EFPC2 TaxID=2812648 RepID=UPI001967251B|nr:carboxynorspermidine decarboxylase [Methylococcus sp. EFPC2]QSA96976.1 carboxynorspermidine decarboxylase [Methylococcus sp. EFPC2]
MSCRPGRLVPATPAFLYDESLILRQAGRLRQAHEASGCRMLYSVKAFPFLPLLRLLAPWLQGFSVSSLYEAKLAAEAGRGSLHIATPGLRPDEIEEIGSLCGYVAFNSLNQFQRLQPALPSSVRAGIRLNPKLSFAGDLRYDPCRPHSKLGADLAETAALWQDHAAFRSVLKGLHVHTAFGVRGFAPLRLTVAHIEEALAPVLQGVEWLNLGGGYVFDSAEDLAELGEIARRLRANYGLEVFFEPGNALVGRAGYLVASVIDRFESDGRIVAVLDTSINHLPEVFEYQKRPELDEPEPEQGMPVILAGCTCLAGDVFGEFRFERPPELGERVVFRHVGAYSLIKAHRFNGHNLPTIYAWDGEAVREMKSYAYGDYRRQWTADGSA